MLTKLTKDTSEIPDQEESKIVMSAIKLISLIAALVFVCAITFALLPLDSEGMFDLVQKAVRLNLGAIVFNVIKCYTAFSFAFISYHIWKHTGTGIRSDNKSMVLAALIIGASIIFATVAK